MIVCDARFRPWLEERIGVVLPSDAQFVGRVVGERIAAAIGVSHWTGPDVELSVAASPGSGSRGLLRTVFAYVFGQLGCVRCTARIRASNQDSIALAERLGFRREGVLRKGYGDEDAIIFGLLREEHVIGRKQATSGS